MVLPGQGSNKCTGAMQIFIRVQLATTMHSSGIHSYACSLVHSELSWWGLKSSMHSHVARLHHCSHHYRVETL
jgi:hypothetical protein